MLAVLSSVEILILVGVVAALAYGTWDVFKNGSKRQKWVAAVLLSVAGLMAIGIWIGGR